MQNLKKHSSGILLLVLLFPAVYQFGHSVFSHHHTEHNTQLSDSLSFSESCEEDDCPICEFEFAVYEGTEHEKTESDNSYTFEAKLSISKIFIQPLYLKNNSLRAPPHKVDYA